ncbi:MAG: hypothetical protein K2P53_04280, partial [Rickettsiales bacterium]|nr:hypothetical protein [Rickettsiales bacterium]
LTSDRINSLVKEITSIKETCNKLQKENQTIKTELEITKEALKQHDKRQFDFENSLNFSQDSQEKKFKEVAKQIRLKSVNAEEEKNKLRQLEDRQRRNNLRLEGLPENESESWEETEVKGLNIFENNLKLKGIYIERAHRTGKVDPKKHRAIVMKLLSYKDKVQILKNAKKLKGTGLYINEDYSLDTSILRKKLFEEMKTHRKNGMYSVVVYDKLIFRDLKKTNINT